jgi:isoquinoline 1-oxidoreductase beta subunit
VVGANIPSYGVPNQLIEFARQPIVVRIAPMRGVGAPVNRFAVECFVDEVAAELQLDPMEMRRRLLRESPRGLKVLERVAAMAGWGTAAAGRGKGLSYSDYGGTYLAAVAEVSCDRSSGVIRVHRIWAAIDPGIAVQPDTILASIEGGLIFGTSMAIKESVSFKNGRAQQTNFFDYPILRMVESPDVEVELMASDKPPTCIAEAAPIVGPAAIANAFASLTGRRVRHMPLSPERVLSAIRA